MNRSLYIFLTVWLLAACASQGPVEKQVQVVNNPEGYTSPNQKIEIELLIQSSPDSQTSSSLSKGKFKAGAIVAKQSREGSDTYITFATGAGELTIDGKTHFVQDGQSFYIPKGASYSYVNRSGKDAVFYLVFTPGGPEQEYKKWSKLKGL